MKVSDGAFVVKYKVEERVFVSIPGRKNSMQKSLEAGENLVSSKDGRLVDGIQRAGGRE